MDLQRQFQSLFDAGAEAKAADFLQELRLRAEKNPDDLETASILLFLAGREWQVRGDAPDIQSALERALAIRENQPTPDPAAIAEALATLAEFHFLAGRWGEAEPLYRRAVALNGKGHAGLAQCLTFLGRTADADPFYAAAIERSEGREGEKRLLYFLYVYRSEGLRQLGRDKDAATLRAKADALLPKNNPGEQGFQV